MTIAIEFNVYVACKFMKLQLYGPQMPIYLPHESINTTFNCNHLFVNRTNSHLKN
jgi:hypothetical protein